MPTSKFLFPVSGEAFSPQQRMQECYHATTSKSDQRILLKKSAGTTFKYLYQQCVSSHLSLGSHNAGFNFSTNIDELEAKLYKFILVLSHSPV